MNLDHQLWFLSKRINPDKLKGILDLFIKNPPIIKIFSDEDLIEELKYYSTRDVSEYIDLIYLKNNKEAKVFCL